MPLFLKSTIISQFLPFWFQAHRFQIQDSFLESSPFDFNLQFPLSSNPAPSISNWKFYHYGIQHLWFSFLVIPKNEHHFHVNLFYGKGDRVHTILEGNRVYKFLNKTSKWFLKDRGWILEQTSVQVSIKSISPLPCYN